MRIALLGLLVVLTLGCERAPPRVDRLDIQLTGSTELDVMVNRSGQGRYVYHGELPESGAFEISPRQFDALLKRVQPFRPKAQTSPHYPRRISSRCPSGKSVLPGAGTIKVLWKGKRLNESYLANLDCDWKRQAVANEALFAALRSLPIPGGDAEWLEAMERIRIEDARR